MVHEKGTGVRRRPNAHQLIRPNLSALRLTAPWFRDGLEAMPEVRSSSSL